MEIKIEDILKYLKEEIATQAQEIAVLKASIDAMQRDAEENDKVE